MSIADSENSSLPHTARSLCREAIEIANELVSRISEAELKTGMDDFLSMAPALTELLEGSQTDISGFDLFNIFNRLATEDSADGLLNEIGVKAEDSDLLKSLNKKIDPKITAAVMGQLLLTMIDGLKAKEDSLLDISSTPDLVEAMSYLDNEILQIAQILSSVKAFDPGMEFVSGKVARKQGAQKGGQIRKEKYEEIREMVIEEARERHLDKKGAQAARAIAEKFSNTDNLLKDEKGKPLSVDPVLLFTKWINEDRKETHSIS